MGVRVLGVKEESADPNILRENGFPSEQVFCYVNIAGNTVWITQQESVLMLMESIAVDRVQCMLSNLMVCFL